MMAFKFNCKECPIKLLSETDLQTHLIVHSDPFGSEKEPPAMTEFLRSFFPNINPSDIPPLNPNSIPSLPDTTPTEEPSSGNDNNNKTYTTLKNMHVPGMVVPNLEELINKILPQPPKKRIRYLNPVRFARDLPMIQPVYIERPPRSPALIQNTYGDDRCSQAAVLRPEVLSTAAPIITRVQRFDPISESERKIEKPRNPIPVRTPKEPGTPPTNPNNSVPQSTPRIPGIGLKLFSCKVCTETFPTLKTMLIHNRTHLFGNLYSCFLCNRRFAFPYQLNNHLLAHTREDHPLEGNRRLGCSGGKRRNQPRYPCTVCKRSFGRINYLNLHKRSHERKEQLGSATEPSPERNLEPMNVVGWTNY